MDQPIVIRCNQCQQRLKVVPLAGPSQVTCPHCKAKLKIAGRPATSGGAANPGALNSGPLNPSQSRGGQPNPVFGGPVAGLAQPSLVHPPQSQSGKTSKKKGGIPKWVFALVGVIVGVPIVCCGVFSVAAVFFKTSRGRPFVPISVTLKACPTPNLITPRGQPERTYPSGIQTYFVRGEGSPDVPGMRMQYRILEPPGEHEPRSLPCVLVAPAGTPLIHGASLEPGGDYDAETLPYAEAGFVVIQYSIDGPLSEGADAMGEEENLQAMMAAYPKFKDSGAGVVNGRNAVEYALSLPHVDPTRIYSAGHSSAGCLSLLLAAHEPRISRCVAYAAAYDLETRMEDLTSNFFMKQMLPDVDKLIVGSSPTNHIDPIECPVFIFHARDDSNVPFTDAERFVERMKAAGKDVTFEVSQTGDHYQSMIDPGIPRAIEWFSREQP